MSTLQVLAPFDDVIKWWASGADLMLIYEIKSQIESFVLYFETYFLFIILFNMGLKLMKWGKIQQKIPYKLLIWILKII